VGNLTLVRFRPFVAWPGERVRAGRAWRRARWCAWQGWLGVSARSP